MMILPKKFRLMEIILGAILSLLIVLLTVFQVQVKQLLTPKAAGGQTEVYLTPADSAIAGIHGFKIFIKPSQAIGFIRLQLAFDKSLLRMDQDVELVNDKFTTVVRKTIPADANNDGKILIVAGLDVNQRDSAPSDLFHLGTVYMAPNTTEANVRSQLDFIKSEIQIVAKTTDVLGVGVVGATITVNPTQQAAGGDTILASPTPSSSAAASPNPASPIPSFLPARQPETGTPTWLTVGSMGLAVGLVLAKKYLLTNRN